jgi:short subunit dehydrogenase-like uncharacterized protein
MQMDVAVILNCAGPFSTTATAFVEACIGLQGHYVDITGLPLAKLYSRVLFYTEERRTTDEHLCTAAKLARRSTFPSC